MIDWSAMPELLDRPTLRRRLGLTRADIDRIFDRAEVYRLPGSTKSYVQREDVREQLEVQAPAAGRA